MKAFGAWSLRAMAGLTVAAFAVVCLAPSLCALATSFGGEGGWPSLEAYRAIFSEGRRWRLLANSLAIGLGAAALATVLGATAGIALEYLKARGRTALAYALTVPLLLPPYLAAIAWIDLLGRRGLLSLSTPDLAGSGPAAFNLYSLGGVVWSLGASYYPVVMWFTIASLRRLDARLEEAARLEGTRARAFLLITLPLLAPAALSGAAFVFILGVVSFSVPSLLQVNSYPVEIYASYMTSSSFAEGAALSVPLVALGLFGLLAWRRLAPGRAWLQGARRGGGPSGVGGAGAWPAAVYCGLLFAVAVAAPIGVIGWRAAPLASFAAAWRTAAPEIGRSLLLAAAVAAVCSVLGLAMAYLERRRAFPRLFAASAAPFLLSGPALGVALIMLWNREGPASIVFDSMAILVLAGVGRFLVFSHQATAAALTDLDRSLEEAAALAGAGWARRLGGITVPLLAPTLAASFGLVFILALGELDVALMVYPPGADTLPIRLFGLMHYGPSQITSALCLITVVLVVGGAAVMAGLYRLAQRLAHAQD